MKQKSEKPTPTWLITYRCTACEEESPASDRDKPRCFYCTVGASLEEVRREKITPELITERLRRSVDNLMEHVKKAYSVEREHPTEGGPTENELLELLAKTQKLHTGIRAEANRIAESKEQDA